MKKLLIVRHAKSSWDDTDLADIDRPLSDRGKKDAPRMAKRLKEQEIYPDIVLTSPAARAVATCDEFCRILSFAKDKVQVIQELYHADEDRIFAVLREVKDLPDKEEVVMIFGHNPGLTEFANTLLDEDIENIPTAGVVACEVNVKNWSALKAGAGALEFFDYPKKRKD